MNSPNATPSVVSYRSILTNGNGIIEEISSATLDKSADNLGLGRLNLYLIYSAD